MSDSGSHPGTTAADGASGTPELTPGGRPGPRAAAIRACLCCGARFPSLHAGNRICEPCKETDEWQATAMLEPFALRGERRR